MSTIISVAATTGRPYREALGLSEVALRRFEVDAMRATDSCLPALRKLLKLDAEQTASIRAFVHAMVYASMRGKAAIETTNEQADKFAVFVGQLLDAIELTDEQHGRVVQFCDAAHDPAGNSA